MAEILVLAERSDGGVRKATLELLTLARRLGEPAAVVLGAAGDAVLKPLAEYGARRVYVADATALEEWLVVRKAEVLTGLVRRTAPGALLATASRESTEIVARVAAALDSGIITAAVDVTAGEGGPVATQSVFANGWTTQSQVTRGTPVITVRPNATSPVAEPVEAAVESLAVPVEGAPAARVEARSPKTGTGRPDLMDASVVVAGGRGMGSADAFSLVEELADALGGAVGASRAAIDLGWYGHDFQIGQTGKTVAPQLYLASGISGAVQHRAGMQASRTIVAINTDPKAPILAFADLGVVGDAHQVLPALIAEVRRRKG